MKKLCKLILSVMLACTLLISVMPLKVEAALTEPPIVNDEYVIQRLCDLARKLGINEGNFNEGQGVYFTENGKPCLNPGEGGHGNGDEEKGEVDCSNCYNGNVINAGWFKELFGEVPVGGLPKQYGTDGKADSNTGWSCFGFANFALWYATSASNTDNVIGTLVTTSTFNKENIQRLLRPGYIIRCDGHSMVFLSAGETTVKVMDCNYSYPSYGNCRVEIRNMPYSRYAGKTMAITRAANHSNIIEFWNTNEGDVIRGEYKIWAKRTDDDANHYAVFYIDGEPVSGYLKADEEGFFAYTIDSSWYSEGVHKLTVKYFNTESEYSHTVNVNFERKIMLWGVEDGQIIDGEQRIFAKRFDDDANHYAEFYLDDNSITGYLTADENDLFSVLINPQTLEEGTHLIKVKYANTTGSWTSTSKINIVKNGLPFPDVQLGAWYYNSVATVYEAGYMNGRADGTFGPNLNLTRAEVATVLYNMENRPNVEYTDKFPDVVDGQWYSKPISWAYQKGIASGYATGLFGVGDNITREQMAQMLYAYARMKGYNIDYAEGYIDYFGDSSSVSEWAKPAMNWAITMGIINGKGSGNDLTKYKLDPAGTTTRAECAAMLKNFMDAYEK